VSFVVAAVSGVAFIIVEMRRTAPLVDLRLFKIFPFAMSCVVRFLNHIGCNAYSLLVALFLQKTLDYIPLQAGLAVLPAALAVGPAGLTVGRLSDRIDSRVIFLKRCMPWRRERITTASPWNDYTRSTKSKTSCSALATVSVDSACRRRTP
jgi:hypothetical protein